MTKNLKTKIEYQDPYIFSPCFLPKDLPKALNIPNHLFVLSCVPHDKTSLNLFRKRHYFLRKLNLTLHPLTSSQTGSIFAHTKKSYITSLETFSQKYFKYLRVAKKLKSLRELKFTAYARYPEKVIVKAWKTMPSKLISSLTIEYPYLADPSVLFRLIAYHRHLKSLTYERLYSSFTSSQQIKHKFNIQRYLKLWEKHFPADLKTLRAYISLLNKPDLESLILKLINLQALELESSNELEDEILKKLAPKLSNITNLQKTSLVFSECYSQQFLLSLLTELGYLKNLINLTILMPLCLSQPLKSPLKLSNQFKELQILNLAVSQAHRGHEHGEIYETPSFYGFFTEVSFPMLKHLRVYLESNWITKPNQDSDELDAFLTFLSSLKDTLESLVIRFWGPSLEFCHWEKIFNVVGTLEGLRNLELSEISYFNNFCLGLISKTISNLKKLRGLYLRPVNLTKTRYLKAFVDLIVSHESLEKLQLMINRFSLEYVEPLLKKLKEFGLRANFQGIEEQYVEVFENKNKRSILGPIFYKCGRW